MENYIGKFNSNSDDYEIESRINSGFYGSVYKAIDKKNKWILVIK